MYTCTFYTKSAMSNQFNFYIFIFVCARSASTTKTTLVLDYELYHVYSEPLQIYIHQLVYCDRAAKIKWVTQKNKVFTGKKSANKTFEVLANCLVLRQIHICMKWKVFYLLQAQNFSQIFFGGPMRRNWCYIYKKLRSYDSHKDQKTATESKDFWWI